MHFKYARLIVSGSRWCCSHLRNVSIQAIVKATAEAKGLELQKAQITEQLLQLRQIEVQRVAVEKWDGKMPSVVTSGGPVPMLDVFNPRHTTRQ